MVPSLRSTPNRSDSPYRGLLFALLLSSLTTPALGQVTSLEVTGPSASYFGSAIAGIGDVDGDGHDDIAVGSYFAQNLRGQVEVFSGKTGQRLRLHPGHAAQERFGETVAAVGDLNGDGVPDYAAAARRAGVESGSPTGEVRAYSGLSGDLMYVWSGPSEGDQLGSSLAGAGDVNGDGFADIIAGALTSDAGGSGSGRVLVFSGQDGALLHSIPGSAPHDELGTSVGGAGDVDADGFADFIAGATGHDGSGDRSGAAFVFSGASGEILHTYLGDEPGDLMGLAVAGLGDIDHDGFDDVAVSSFGSASATTGGAAGSVRVFSSREGSVHFSASGSSPGDWFGQRLACAGDVDGDGVLDLVAGSYRVSAGGPFAGGAHVLSGASGATLLLIRGPGPQAFTAWAVAGGGDTNGDGFDEVLVGTLRDTTVPGSAGSVKAYSRPLPSTGIACLGQANSSGGRASLSLEGSTAAALNSLSLVAGDLPRSSTVVFLNSRAFGVTAAPMIGASRSRGHLCLSASNLAGLGRHRPISADAGRTARLAIDLTDVPSAGPGYRTSILAGETWFWQGWYRDRTSFGLSNFTDALAVTLY
ncbi:MAG: FG-GAP-like repeat-containing protein [Planctomycetota bacterium]